MIKYFAWAAFNEIKQKEIVKESAKTVTIKTGLCGNHRESKISEDRGYFDTWQQAKDFIISYWNAEVSRIEARASRTRDNRREAEGMQEPPA
ncbi:hypothetical protein M0R72_19665 [Candidatus Pacearchaeota archaeon]|nr:hypothetical protein [Candidatus Pacearchaeota archaeon]